MFLATPFLDTFVNLLPEFLPAQSQDSKELGRLEDALRRQGILRRLGRV